MNLQKLTDMMAGAPDSVITVLGDFCLDKYLYIDANRDEPSLETKLTAYQVTHKGLYPGGAGTVVNNLRGLTAQTLCVGIVGDDGEGFELLRALRQVGADTTYMVTDQNRCTSTYTKPMRGENGKYTELNRLDFKNFEPVKPDVEAKIIENMRICAAKSKALLVLDQFVEEDCGVVNTNVRNAIFQVAKENPDLIIYADSRAFIHLFAGVIVKCNNFEVVKSVEPDYAGGEPDAAMVLEYGNKLFQKNKRPVFVTMGKHGIMAFDETGAHHSDAIDVPGPFDICGAGDSASSGIVLALTLGATPEEAALMGNLVASITIQQIGVTGFATPKQVIDRFAEYCQ